MALCRDCSKPIPCNCHLTPAVQVRPGVYLADTTTRRSSETFGHEPFDYDGVPICARCFIQHNGWREAIDWPCTSAIVLGLVPRPSA